MRRLLWNPEAAPAPAGPLAVSLGNFYPYETWFSSHYPEQSPDTARWSLWLGPSGRLWGPGKPELTHADMAVDVLSDLGPDAPKWRDYAGSRWRPVGLLGSAGHMVRVLAYHAGVFPSELVVDVFAPLTSAQARTLKELSRADDWRGYTVGVNGSERSVHTWSEVMATIRDAGFMPRSLANPDATLIQRAVEKFGTTDDPWEAGYILPDGRMLDLKRTGRDWWQGTSTQFVEHRDVPHAVGMEIPNATMKEFMRQSGAARFSKHRLDPRRPATMLLHTVAPLTVAQRARVLKALEPSMTFAAEVWAPGESHREMLYSKLVYDADERDVKGEFSRMNKYALQAQSGKSLSLQNPDKSQEHPWIKRAVRTYGTTERLWDAGFIFPDGRMLDLKRQGDKQDRADWPTDIINHTEVPARIGGWPEYNSDGIVHFMARTGAIRFGKGHWGKRVSWGGPGGDDLFVHLAGPLTEAQRTRVLGAREPGLQFSVEGWVARPADPRGFTTSLQAYQSVTDDASKSDINRELRRAEQGVRALGGNKLGEVQTNPCPSCRHPVRYRAGAGRVTCPACRSVLGIRR